MAEPKSTRPEKGKGYGVISTKTAYFETTLREMVQNRYINLHAYAYHYMPLFKALKQRHPSILLLEYEGTQWIFFPEKAQDIRNSISVDKNALSEQLSKAMQGVHGMDDLIKEHGL